MITRLEIDEVKTLCNAIDPTKWQKRRLVTLLLKAHGHGTKSIDANNHVLLDQAFITAKNYFNGNASKKIS